MGAMTVTTDSESFVPFPAKFLKAAGWQPIWRDRYQLHQS